MIWVAGVVGTVGGAVMAYSVFHPASPDWLFAVGAALSIGAQVYFGVSTAAGSEQ